MRLKQQVGYRSPLALGLQPLGRQRLRSRLRRESDGMPTNSSLIGKLARRTRGLTAHNMAIAGSQKKAPPI